MFHGNCEVFWLFWFRKRSKDPGPAVFVQTILRSYRCLAQETLRSAGAVLRTHGAHLGLQQRPVLWGAWQPRHGGAVQLWPGSCGETIGGSEDLQLPGRSATSRFVLGGEVKEPPFTVRVYNLCTKSKQQS